MGSFSIWHWLIVLVIVMLVFGTKKLRNIGADLGGAVRGFKDGMREGDKAAEAASPGAQISGKTVEGKVHGPMPDKKVKAQVSGHIDFAKPEKDAAHMAKHHEKGPRNKGKKK